MIITHSDRAAANQAVLHDLKLSSDKWNLIVERKIRGKPAFVLAKDGKRKTYDKCYYTWT